MNDVMSTPVLVPDPAGRGAGLLEALREFGLAVDHHPFLELRMQRDSDTRDAVAGLAAGRFGHVVVTAPRVVDVLVSYDEDGGGAGGTGGDGHDGPRLSVPDGVTVIAVGHETAAALQDHGIEPALVTREGEQAVGQELPATGSGQEPLLLLGSATTPASVPQSLQERGYRVTTVVTYRPKPVDLGGQLVRDLRMHGYGAIALSDPMLATLAGHLGIHQDIRVVTADAATTVAAEAKGLVVHGQAAEPTGRALAEAVRRALTEQTRTTP